MRKANYKMYVAKRMSKKNTVYTVLEANAGYRKIPISFNMPMICELTGLTYQELYNIKVGEAIEVGSFNID